MKHPYQGLPDHQFWRRGVSLVEPHLLDPVVSPRFRIGQMDRVATAGSCFAQHISRRLQDIGFSYFVPEHGQALDVAERKRRNYGVFSARFGNLYTVRQLLQLLQEALGQRVPSEQPWVRDDGRWVDPLRPNIEPDGFASIQEVVAARVEHIGHVRNMFLQADVFVFTLGLTEGWVDRSSGDVFPLAPGVSGGSFDATRYLPVNFGVDELRADLDAFLRLLKSVNPGVRVLLTVSPVPLIATFEPRHVLVSTTLSKSLLRVAADAAVQRFHWVDYFPSYEIITGAFNFGRYYEEDLREVNDVGVSHAMRCFLSHYAEGAPAPGPVVPLLETAPTSHAMSQVVCDEESIARVSF